MTEAGRRCRAGRRQLGPLSASRGANGGGPLSPLGGVAANGPIWASYSMGPAEPALPDGASATAARPNDPCGPAVGVRGGGADRALKRAVRAARRRRAGSVRRPGDLWRPFGALVAWFTAQESGFTAARPSVGGITAGAGNRAGDGAAAARRGRAGGTERHCPVGTHRSRRARSAAAPLRRALIPPAEVQPPGRRPLHADRCVPEVGSGEVAVQHKEAAPRGASGPTQDAELRMR